MDGISYSTMMVVLGATDLILLLILFWVKNTREDIKELRTNKAEKDIQKSHEDKTEKDINRLFDLQREYVKDLQKEIKDMGASVIAEVGRLLALKNKST